MAGSGLWARNYRQFVKKGIALGRCPELVGENVRVKALKSGSQRRKITIVRSQLAKGLVEEWGLSLTETGRHLGVSTSAIAKTLYRLDKHKSS